MPGIFKIAGSRGCDRGAAHTCDTALIASLRGDEVRGDLREDSLEANWVKDGAGIDAGNGVARGGAVVNDRQLLADLHLESASKHFWVMAMSREEDGKSPDTRS